MDDCIFCKIVQKAIPAYIVHEDDSTLAFLNIHPIRPGHVLVIPKHHEPNLYALDNPAYQAVMASVQLVSNRIASVLEPKKVGLMVMGWDVPHAHVHVVPMQDAGDITSTALQHGEPPTPVHEELARMAQSLSL